MNKLKVYWNNFLDRLKRLVHRGSTQVSAWSKPTQDKIPPQSGADYPFRKDVPPYNLP